MLTVIIIFIIALLLVVYALFKSKGIDVWWLNYIKGRISVFRLARPPRIHILFCFVDHYEPRWRTTDIEDERRRVDNWVSKYPIMAGRHQDADGCHPKHTFFYPEEEYRKEHLDKIQGICKQGYGEVEIHLHHHDDNETDFRRKISEFRDLLVSNHGLLSKDPEGKPGFAFIHGNWALDNSDPKGINCGINNEITILREEGCYLDMTMPSSPHPTQTSKVNSIYMAIDDTEKPKSHDTGKDVEFNRKMQGDLLMVQGPLCFNWHNKKLGIIPKIENGDIRKTIPPGEKRIDMWVRQHIHIKGNPEWVFIKIHTHGAQDQDMDTLLGSDMDEMFSYLENKYNDGEKYVLHYVTAREVYNIIRAASDGKKGNPNRYRDYYYSEYS